MIIEEDIKLDYSDVLLVPSNSKIKSRNDVNITSYLRTKIPVSNIPVVPIIAANMDHVGTFKMAVELSKFGVMTALIKHYSNIEIIDFLKNNPQVAPYVFVSIGIREEELEKFYDLMDIIAIHNVFYPRGVCIDAANGYSKEFLIAVKSVSSLCKGNDFLIMAGNVVTGERTFEIAQYADIVKVGVGPGSACSTRRETGIGYPQFSAVVECSKYGNICADGGITCPGDVVKALAAGATCVMIGGEFAGHLEGYTDEELGNLHSRGLKVPYYGSASKFAQVMHNDGLADYRASEGREFMIDQRGHINNTIKHYLGGLRSGMSYCNWSSINEMIGHGHFVKVNRILNDKYNKYEVK